MAVIPALDTERKLYSKRIEQLGRERSERNDNVVGIEQPPFSFDAPTVIGPAERTRIAGQDHPAKLGKMRHIGLGDCQWIDDADSAGPMHGMADRRGDGSAFALRP